MWTPKFGGLFGWSWLGLDIFIFISFFYCFAFSICKWLFMVFLILFFGCHQLLYTVGLPPTEGAQLNVTGGGFLLGGLEHWVVFNNLCLSMSVFLCDLYFV
jgi:hypothetical protein